MNYNAYVDETALGVAFGMVVTMLVIILVAYVLGSIVLMKLFNKAGREGWKAWVPFLNTWTMLEICYMPGWLVLLAFVPIVNFAYFIVNIIAMYRLPQCYEKSQIWGLFGVIVPFIVQIICAFDSSEYCGYER